MTHPRMRYRSLIADSARWDDFPFRAGDIVISTPPKCGTTWTQMLCALLIFDGPVFPAPLDDVSPWVDMCNQSIASLRATLAAQTHRRFIKTHTPLDGIPFRDEVTYVVVGRDPRDVAISYEHHAANMDFDHFLTLRKQVMGDDGIAEFGRPGVLHPDPVERMRTFVRSDQIPGPLSLAIVLHHMTTAWERRHDPNVLLLHYADMKRDLVGETRQLAATLGIPLTAARAEELTREAGLDRMRARAGEIAPSASQGNWKDPKAFFRTGGSGEWRDRFDAAGAAEYEARVAALASAEVAAWTHLGRIASGIDPQA